ncbi:DMT family transporter [Acinetobacter sp. S40]|uniref:DMT family transporter n=1 Tax=Acinetobacter sp. S40 TaxID=2767434 RepID=UPI00190DBAE2|nr:DMT family transporter [Acinetobacter sp. S40]MBJ9986960.1 DMT family transporter [Acinetobacter sp. S40]
MNALLYMLVVFIFGTTWIAISAQHGHITPVVAVFWRFFIAALILFTGLCVYKRLKKLTFMDHLFCLLQGLCIFGLNFICFYNAVDYVNSGLEAVIFSMAVIFNALNSCLFFKQRISVYFIPAIVCGLLGMLALFWHNLTATEIHGHTIFAILLCVLGTYGFSLGNMISLRHQQHGRDVLSTNAYGMLYGATLMAIVAVLRGEDFFPTSSGIAISALLYLAVVGSVIGFSAYFLLVGRIGAGQAAYTTLLFPLVALTLSTFWEGYQWTWSAGLGVILILLGNFILFYRPQWILKLPYRLKSLKHQ